MYCLRLSLEGGGRKCIITSMLANVRRSFSVSLSVQTLNSALGQTIVFKINLFHPYSVLNLFKQSLASVGVVLIFTDLEGPSSSSLPVNNNSVELLKYFIETSLLGYIKVFRTLYRRSWWAVISLGAEKMVLWLIG